MNRREMLRGALGLSAAGAFWPGKDLFGQPGGSQAPVAGEIEHVYLVGAESGWLSVEMLVGTQDLWLDKSRYALKGLYWSEEPRPFGEEMVKGYFGAVVPRTLRTRYDHWRYGSCRGDADHQWVIGLQSFQLANEGIRTQFAVLSERCAKITLTVLTEPSLVAAYEVLDQSARLEPYSDCRVVAVPDYPWNRFIERWRRYDGDVVLTSECEDLYRRLQWEHCDAVSRSVIDTFARKEASGFKPSDVVPAYRRGWA